MINGSFSREDLVQEGVIALIRAIRRFDEEEGYVFSSFVVVMIKRHLRRALDNKDAMITIPVRVREYLRKLYQVKKSREQELGKSVNVLDLMREMNYSSYYGMALAARGEMISLNENLNDDSETCFIDVIPSEEIVDGGIMRGGWFKRI